MAEELDTIHEAGCLHKKSRRTFKKLSHWEKEA